MLENKAFVPVYNEVLKHVQDVPAGYVIVEGEPSGYSQICKQNFAQWCHEFHSLHIVEGALQPYDNNSDVRVYLALPQTGTQNQTEVDLWTDYSTRTNLTGKALEILPQMIGSELPLFGNSSCTQTAPIVEFNSDYSLQMFMSHSTLATCNDFLSFVQGAVAAYPGGYSPMPSGSTTSGNGNSHARAVIGGVVGSIAITAIVAAIICKWRGWLCFPSVTAEQKYSTFIKDFNKLIAEMTVSHKKSQLASSSLNSGLLGNIKTLRSQYIKVDRILSGLHQLHGDVQSEIEKQAISTSLVNGRAALAKFSQYKPDVEINGSGIPLSPPTSQAANVTTTQLPVASAARTGGAVLNGLQPSAGNMHSNSNTDQYLARPAPQTVSSIIPTRLQQVDGIKSPRTPPSPAEPFLD